MIKNVEIIKKKAKNQIFALLNKMGCYTFTEKGIDKWLDKWERANEKQITQIAEKHPYYDGDAKIVFPAEYQRKIDKYQINCFADWLYNYANRNVKEVFIDGFSYVNALKISSLNDYLLCSSNIINEMKENIPEEMVELLNKISLIIDDDDLRTYVNKAVSVRREFRRYSKYCINGDKAYNIEEYSTLSNIPMRLFEFITNTEYGYNQFLTDGGVEYLKYNFPECRFGKGQRVSRAVMTIGRKYGLTKDPEWEKEFANFANAINPLTVTKWTVISWHPIDYLTFCFGDSWSSCCTIDKSNVRGIKIRNSRSSITSYVNEDYEFAGDHSAAALSYMFDNSSFIYYTVSDKYKGKLYEEQDKNTRIVFSLSDDMTTLIETRLYPQCNDDNPDDTAYRVPREIVQKVLCDSIDVPNLWTVKKGTRACCKYAISEGVHYADYKDERNKQCNISYRGDEPSRIYIGHNAICPYCGKIHAHISSLNCPSCDPLY